VSKALTYSNFKDKQELIERYSPLVKRIAHHLAARLPASVHVDDLFQAGMLGLFEAAGKFDPTKGAKFETFAGIRIRGSMLDEVRKGDWVPRSVHRNNRMISEVIERLEQELGRDAKDSEIAQKLDCSVQEYHTILKDVFVGKVIGIEDLGIPDDMLQSSSEENFDGAFEKLVDSYFRQALIDAIKSLPERESQVLSLYYDEAMSLKEIGLVLRVSESRVSQIHSQALLRLKAKLRSWSNNTSV
jgi:RNA polymerase sigma factor for flagellar operon FliA